MAVLRVIRGQVPHNTLPLSRERTVIGRHPNCEVVLDGVAVSRHHAQILESHGSYYLEDLRSRNGTFLNGERVERRERLHVGDEIRICDVVFRFERPISTGRESALTEAAVPVVPRDSATRSEPGDAEHRSSVVSKMAVDSSGTGLRLDVNPEAKLRAMLDIANDLARTVETDDVLSQILASLFRIFPQADRGFAVLLPPGEQKPQVRATRTRRGSPEDSLRISWTVVHQALETREAILSADAVTDERFSTSESLSGANIHSMMCVPLIGKSDEAFGVIQIDTSDSAKRFSQQDLEVLVSVAALASLAVENAGLYEESVRNRVLAEQIAIARQVQLSFLPSERPRLPGYQFCDYYESMHQIGGDYFDYVPLPDGRIAVGLGDVAGKGVPAALLMARLSSSARYQLLTRPSPAEAVDGLNAEFASAGLGHRYITLVLAVLDPVSHELIIANAGHMPPLLRKADGSVHEVGRDESGIPVGLEPDETFGETTLPLEPGDMLLLFTDGVTEAMDPDEDLYGSRRLREFVARGPEDSLGMVDGIIGDVEAFCRGRAPSDDQCIVCIRRLP